MKKLIGTFFIDFVCNEENVDNNIKFIKYELSNFGFNNSVKFIKYDNELNKKFVAIIELICSNDNMIEKTVIKTYFIFNHIVKQINNKNGNYVFKFSKYHNYDELVIVYSNNRDENMYGFPIKCDVDFSFQEIIKNDSFSESLDNIFKNLSI